MITTEQIPYEIFNIGAIARYAVPANAEKALEQFKSLSVKYGTTEEYEIVQRKDGFFRILAIDHVDEMCYYCDSFPKDTKVYMKIM